MTMGTCLSCFTVNVKIFDVKDTHLQSAYEKITDLKIQNDSHGLCYICRARLQQCYLLVKQTLKLQKSPQGDSNEREEKSLVKLSTENIESTSIPYDCVTIKQEPDVKEENSDHMNEEDVENNTEDFKYETVEGPATSSSFSAEFKQDKAIHTDLKGDGVRGNPVNLAEIAGETNILNKLKERTSTQTDDKPYICDICNKKCKRSGDFKKHKRRHTGEKPYRCDVCNKKFSQSSELKAHKRTHTGEKPYSCDICNKKFSQSSNLKRHILTHTDIKPYSCDICNKKFSQNESLKIHRSTHNGDQPYTCDICDKKYPTSRCLKTHKRTHTGDKPYSCNICDKKYRTSGSLKMHKRTHTDEKPYSCDICDKKYKANGSLKIHKRTHTGEKKRGHKKPVYISEPLSPTAKDIYAATRAFAEEKQYRFVWSRNGKIFLRKSIGTDVILVKSKNVLKTLE